MERVTIFFVSGMLVFGVLIFVLAIYNLLFKYKQNVRVRYLDQLSPEEAADLSCKMISKYPKWSTIYILAGEFNYLFYAKFVPFLYKLIDEMKLKVIVIGGPHISVATDECKDNTDPSSVNMILDAAFRNKIKLYLKRYGRENHHFIVSLNDDSIALLEDLHLEHKQRGTSLIYNSKVYCDNLRHRFESILNKDKDLLLVNSDSTCEKLRSRFKTPKEFNSKEKIQLQNLKNLSEEVPWIGY